MLLGDPIVGIENVTYDDVHGFGARQPKDLPSPKEPTAAQRARHDCTHLPYEPWCPICVSGKRGNSHHRPSHEALRAIPFVVADYAFLRNEMDEDLATVLVIKVLPFKIFFACLVSVKGPDLPVVQRVAQLFKDLGLVHFVYRSDQESAIKSLLDQAVITSGRSGKSYDDLTEQEKTDVGIMEELDADDYKQPDSSSVASDRILVATPERSMPGESPSNGIAERAVQQLEDQIRTMKLAPEARLKVRIPMDHPIMAWMVEHASHLLTKYHVGPDGRTGFGRLHGKEVSERICEFGERVLYYVPKKLRSKMDARWKYGVFVGRAMHSDINYIALTDGSVTQARAMARLASCARWSG